MGEGGLNTILPWPARCSATELNRGVLFSVAVESTFFSGLGPARPLCAALGGSEQWTSRPVLARQYRGRVSTASRARIARYDPVKRLPCEVVPFQVQRALTRLGTCLAFGSSCPLCGPHARD